jgi:hypothetical protein
MSSYFDSTPPSDSYNVTRPYENGANKAAPTQFRALAFNDKRKDMMGRDIDLDNMPAETKQLRSAYGPETRFDDNVTSLDQTVILNDMDTQDRTRQKQLAHMNGGKGAPVNPSTGMIQREPLKGYNNTTGQYFSMDPSGKKISNDRAVAWAEAIRAADDRKAAIVRGVNADKQIADDGKNRFDLAGRKIGLEEEIERNTNAYDMRKLEGEEQVTKFNQGETVLNSADTRRRNAQEDQIKSDEAINKMPPGSPMLKKRVADAGGEFNTEAQKRAEGLAAAAAVIGAINAGDIPVTGLASELGGVIAHANLAQPGGLGQLTTIRERLRSLAERVAASYNYDPEIVKGMLVDAVMAGQSSEKLPQYGAIKAALLGASR